MDLEELEDLGGLVEFEELEDSKDFCWRLRGFGLLSHARASGDVGG